MTGVPRIRFTPGAKTGIVVDLPTLLETRLLVQGSSGAGKTTLLYQLLQETYGHAQHIILDKEGVYTKLREHYEYLLVGPDGDVPIDLHRGVVETLMRRVCELGVNVIVDLSDNVPDQQHAFVARAARWMAHVNARSDIAQGTRIVLIDEVQHFAPESGKGSAESALPLVELASLGRKRGFTPIAATLRLSGVAKSFTEILDNKLIGRAGTNDSKRAADELDFDRHGRHELRALATGHFYAYGPAIESVDPVLVRSNTDLLVLPPKRGERVHVSATTPAAIAEVVAALADVPQDAERETVTLDEARAEIDTLRKALKRAGKGDAPAPVTVEKIVVDHEATTRAVEAERTLLEHRFAEKLGEISGFAQREVKNNAAALAQQIATYAKGISESRAPIVPAQPSRPTLSMANGSTIEFAQTKPRADRAPMQQVLSAPMQRVLDTLGELVALGLTAPTTRQVAVFMGVSAETGTFKQYIRDLAVQGFIERKGDGMISLTHDGRTHATMVPAPRAQSQLVDAWMARLSGPQADLLRVIVDAHPATVHRATLGTTLNKSHQTGTFKQDLRDLRNYGLVHFTTDGEVGATDLLFPHGMQ